MLAPYALVQVLGKGLGEPVRQCLGQNAVVIVVMLFEIRAKLIESFTCRDGEPANVISNTHGFRCQVVGETKVGSPRRFFGLLAKAVYYGDDTFPVFIGIHLDIVAHGVGGEEADDASRDEQLLRDDAIQQSPCVVE